MSNKGYVATAGGFCIAISTTSETQETVEKPTNTAKESAKPSTQITATPLIKESA